MSTSNTWVEQDNEKQHSLARRLSRTQRGLRNSLGLLLACSLVALFLLLLVRERGQPARNLAHFYVAQGQCEFADVMLEEGGVERLVLVFLNDVLDEIIGEFDKVLLGAWLRGDKPVELLRGRAWRGGGGPSPYE